MGKRIFRKIFRSKTSNSWGEIGSSFVQMPGKYKILQKAKCPVATGTWQYYLHNSIDGKDIGWYNYDDHSAKNMEKFYQLLETNEGLDVRSITTNYFTYEVDFRNMLQTNTSSGTRRAIRRVPPGEVASETPPSILPQAA